MAFKRGPNLQLENLEFNPWGTIINITWGGQNQHKSNNDKNE